MAVAEATNGFETFYSGKPATYFAGARADFVALLPRDPNAAILEIGCGSGETGALALEAGRCARYVGVELFEAAASRARTRLSDVITGNVETMTFPWQPASFDALILSEVLEHLVEPGRVVADLARFVRPGGMVLASSPNVAHWRVVRELVCGRFNLADQGVFDRTHMRWFTPATYAAMFEAAGFTVTDLRPVTPFSPRTQLISKMTGGRLDHLFMTQIAIMARRR
ncbi:MAG: class I SAM-dependent methyltransferase [Hyphomicrobium sp.]